MRKSDPFKVDPLPKAFYYPSRKKELTKKEKKVCLSVPISSQQVTSPEDVKFLKETNAIKEIPTRENGSYADHSSSSQFNESWPNTEQAGFLCSPVSERTVSSAEMSQQMREWLIGQDKPTTNSTLGWFINRFRNAPPTSRQQRDITTSTNEKQDFWWLSPPSGQSTPMLDTPPQKLKPSPKKGSSQKENIGSSPSPAPSHGSTEDLNKRAKELLERSETSIETTSTEPFPLPLKKPSSVNQIYPEAKPRQSSHPPHSNKHITQSTNMLPTSFQQHHNPYPEDDILYQWRLARKMEKAQERAATDMDSKGVSSLGRKMTSDASSLERASRQSISAMDEHGVHDRVTSSHRTHDHAITHSRPSDTLPLASVYVKSFKAKPRTAVSTSASISQSEGLPDTSPVDMVTTYTQRIPLTKPIISHPCRHLKRTSIGSNVNILPHMHLACDILPCPCTEAVNKKSSDSQTHQDEKQLPQTQTKSQNGRYCSEEWENVKMDSFNQENQVYSKDEKEGADKNKKEKKGAEFQGIRGSDEEDETDHFIDKFKPFSRSKRKHSGRREFTNENKNGEIEIVHDVGAQNSASDMVESIIGKVVSEHLFSGDIPSNDSNHMDRAVYESQQHDNGLSGYNVPAESSEEFVDDDILKMLRQRSKDLQSQLREIDSLIAPNQLIMDSHQS